MAGKKSRIRAARLLFLALLFNLCGALPAHALTLSAPGDVLGTVNVRVSLTASDPVGLAVLTVDGVAVRKAAATGTAIPKTLSFDGISLAPGSHRIRVALRSQTGLEKSGSLRVVSWKRPTPALLVSPAGAYAGARAVAMVRVGLDTTRIALRLNGRLISVCNVKSGSLVNIGTIALAAGLNSIQVDAVNPVAKATGTFKIRRLEYPWPTCIVIDKSSYKLFWVRDGMLVKTYPIAIGKPSTPTPSRTWRVGEKLYESSGGVYGPRRLRLYRKSGSSYSWTGYGIHGTNQPWVIGTMASHGCIRLYNRDILDLWPQVPLNTMVLTRD